MNTPTWTIKTRYPYSFVAVTAEGDAALVKTGGCIDFENQDEEGGFHICDLTEFEASLAQLRALAVEYFGTWPRDDIGPGLEFTSPSTTSRPPAQPQPSEP